MSDTLLELARKVDKFTTLILSQESALELVSDDTLANRLAQLKAERDHYVEKLKNLEPIRRTLRKQQPIATPPPARIPENGATAIGEGNNSAGAQAVIVDGSVGGSIVTGTYQANYYGEQLDWKAIEDPENGVIANYLRNIGGVLPSMLALPIDIKVATIHKTNLDNAQTTYTTNTITSWQSTVEHPVIGLLMGEPHSGKNFLLVAETWRLVKLAIEELSIPVPLYKAQLPLFLSLNDIRLTSDTTSLLDRAANTYGLESRVIRALWEHPGKRPICLLIDGADELPEKHWGYFLNLLKALRDSNPRSKNSIIVSCRVGALLQNIEETLERQSQFCKWVIQPLTASQVKQWLEQKKAQPALINLVHSNFTIRHIASNIGMLTALFEATTDVNNPGQIDRLMATGHVYKLLIDDHIFGKDEGHYKYERVKKRVLARLAFQMVRDEVVTLPIDDAVCFSVAEDLATISQRFERSRDVMPRDWRAEELLMEIFQKTSVLQPILTKNIQLEFRESSYRDYFAAVYLAALSPDQWDKLIEANTFHNIERWSETLIQMISLNPSTTLQISRLFAEYPGQVADIWLERKPAYVQIPQCVPDGYKKRFDSLSRQPVMYSDCFIPLRRLLKSDDALVRLNATCVLTQMGLGAIEGLLEAVQDPHKIVRAVATHALFHLCEFTIDTGKPVPPLIQIDGDSFSFSSKGTCSGYIGPLLLASLPPDVPMNVNITIDHVVDVDLLTVDADFILSYTPPAWFAADLFNRTRRVDWLELLAQLQWVIYCNQQVVQAIGSQPALQALADRFRHIISMYQCLCDTALIDLDLPIESATTYSDIVKADSEDSWSWLRQLYSRTNRLKILNAANDAFSSNAESAQKIENLKPNTVLLGLNLLDVNVESRDTDLADDSNNLKISAIRAAHHLTALTQAGLYGIKMQTLTGADPGSPAVLFLVNSIDIENSDHGDVVGIFADNINGINGIRAEINLHIETFTNSTLIGAAAGNGPYKFPLPGQHSVQSPPEVAKSPAL